MKSKYSISCVITLFNRQEYINNAIESVLNQSLKPDEIIIVDNSSKKISINKNYLGKIKIFNILPKAGIAQALNFGVSIAKGDYISFLEDDDYWPQNYLECVFSKSEFKYDYIVTPIKKLENGQITNYKNPKGKVKLNNFLLSNPGINISNLSVQKAPFYAVGGFDVDLITSVDKSLIIKFILNKYTCCIREDVSTIKRFHKNNFTFKPGTFLTNLRIFYFKYSYLMSFKIKLKFFKKYLYYKFIKNV